MTGQTYEICALPSGQFAIAVVGTREIKGEPRPWVVDFHGPYSSEPEAARAIERLRLATPGLQRVAA
jgi:hypothetical protein